MRRKEQASNLVPYMQLLTPNEKAVLCGLLNVFNNTQEYHQGMLPFVDRGRALLAVGRIDADTEKGTRIFRQILTKLTTGEPARTATSYVRWSMRLDDLKVYRRFGPHPERGKPLPFLGKERVTVGMKFSLPRGAYVPDKDVLVSPCVTLKRQSQGLWQVEVLARCQHTVEEWLITNCQ